MRSCGCLRSETSAAKAYKHGMSGSPEWRVWAHIRQRCHNPTDAAFAHYGGRGIRVCDRWRESFDVFYEDMGPRPEGTTIDRIDNDGDYEPGNCRWAPKQTQVENRRVTKRLTIRGETKLLTEWASELGIPRYRIYERLARGATDEEALRP